MTRGGLAEQLRKERESDALACFRGDRRADEPARLLSEEADDVRGDELGRHDDVRLFLTTVGVVDENGVSGPQSLYSAGDGILHVDDQGQGAY